MRTMAEGDAYHANHALARREHAEGRTVLAARPQFLILDPTSRCNARCVMCHVSFRPRGVTGEDLPLALFEEMAPVIPLSRHVNLFSTGEPTIAPHIVHLIRESRRRAHPEAVVWLCTNGKHLPDEVLEAVMQPGMGLQFSVDGGSREVFEAIRRGITFAQLCRSLEAASARRGERAYPPFQFSTNVSKRNVHDLANVFALASRYGVERVLVYEENAEVPEEEAFLLDESDRPVFEAQLPAIEASGVSYSNTLHFRGPTHRWPRPAAGTLRCVAPWKVFHLHADGDVRPCCNMRQSMGNLGTSGFEGVWNGEAYVRLRRAFVEQQGFPEDCLACVDPLRTWEA
jgi:MoaA/NifB/PqqE/SkfB family radical SAM enzyme